MRFAHNGHALALGVLSGTGKIHHMECVADDLIESVAELPAWLEEKREMCIRDSSGRRTFRAVRTH